MAWLSLRKAAGKSMFIMTFRKMETIASEIVASPFIIHQVCCSFKLNSPSIKPE